MKKLLFLLICILTLSCTENIRSKKFGGSMTIQLQPNEKLVNLTWKQSDLWVLTRPMKKEESPEVYKFTEKSGYGILQGDITIIENK
jgi:hypothetical protein